MEVALAETGEGEGEERWVECTVRDSGPGFGAAEAAVARGLQRRGVPLAVIEEAMLMGACRKYTSWFEGRALEPIRGLCYFEPLIAEIQEKPFPPGYSAYLRMKVRQFAEHWNQSAKSGKTLQGGGYPGMPSPRIVQRERHRLCP